MTNKGIRDLVYPSKLQYVVGVVLKIERLTHAMVEIQNWQFQEIHAVK